MSRCALPLFLWAGLFASTFAKYVPFQELSFLFDYNKITDPTPALITAQCETINLRWGRNAGEAVTGPSAVAPYKLKVFTSTHTTPFVVEAGSGQTFDWQVPFAPRTRYQICMFDSQGNSGGCQNEYTMISATGPPTCANVTDPSPRLEVQGRARVSADTQLSNSSQFAFVPQCTDMEFLPPRNGTPPFTLTVAPALHPPWIIKSDNFDPIRWTVALSRASRFYVGVSDSTGRSYSQGPLHSGFGPDVSCLSLNGEKQKLTSTAAVAAGASIGGLVGGALLGVLAAFLYARIRARRPQPEGEFKLMQENSGSGGSAPLATSGAPPGVHTFASNCRNSTESSQFQIQPYVIGVEPQSTAATVERSNTVSSIAASSQIAECQNVYVVHHDGGRAPVTVYTSDGQEVVELPPRYNGEDSPALSTFIPRRGVGLPSRPSSNRNRSTDSGATIEPMSSATLTDTELGPSTSATAEPFVSIAAPRTPLVGFSFEQTRQPGESPSKNAS